MEHQGALTALLFLPVGAVASLPLLEEAARRHLRVASGFGPGTCSSGGLGGPDIVLHALTALLAPLAGWFSRPRPPLRGTA